jgi:hypothetical protein
MADETYVGGLRDVLGSFRARALFILDEAHHAAPASGSRYAVDSQFTRAVRGLAERFEHRLFLSATPHNGHSNSFSSLLEILDPQRWRGLIQGDRELLSCSALSVVSPVSRAQRSAKRCAADLQSPQTPSSRRSRLSGAPLRAAPQPGHVIRAECNCQ